MNPKMLGIALGSVALVCASIAAIVVSTKNSARARTLLRAKEAAVEAAELEKKTADQEAAAEAAKARATEAEAKRAKEDRVAKEAAAKQAKADAEAAKENRKAAEAAKVASEKNAEAARANQQAKKHEADAAADLRAKAEAEKKAAEAKASEAASRLAMEKLKAEKELAETKRLELLKVDYETWGRDLKEWAQELAERERALTPEKTVDDLSWAGGKEDTVFDEDGKITKKAKEPYLAENDKKLSRATRALSRVERLADEASATNAVRVRTEMVAMLTKLREKALREDRVIDADYYQSVMTALYPDAASGK